MESAAFIPTGTVLGQCPSASLIGVSPFPAFLISAYIDRTRITLSLAWVRREIR